MGHTTAYNRIQQGDAIHERFDELDAGQAAIQRTVRAEASKNKAAAEDAIGELEAAVSEGIPPPAAKSATEAVKECFVSAAKLYTSAWSENLSDLQQLELYGLYKQVRS